MRRTQGECEPVADYLTCMIALFDRLSPLWSEREKLDYASKYVTEMQVAIRRDEVLDLDMLEILATRAECSYDAVRRYQRPSTPDKSLFPDLAYRAPKRTGKSSREKDTLAVIGVSEKSNARQNRKNSRSTAE